VVAIVAVCVVVVTVFGLGFYAVRKMRPQAFRLRATLLKVFSFSMEIESSSAARTPADGLERTHGLASGGDRVAAEPQPPSWE
jgi:hypothetical protein